MTPQTHASTTTVEPPILWLGMSGFDPHNRAALERCLARPLGMARWRVCELSEADAWWVNGAKVRVLPDGNLKVAAGLPTERALRLNLSDIDRPVAFAKPLSATEFEPRCTFEVASQPSIQAVLQQFETYLRLLRVQFVLGFQIIECPAKMRRGVYHVLHGANLLAVLDFARGKASLSPRVQPDELEDAVWYRRPDRAGGLPNNFVPLSAAQLAWAYVRHTDRDMLPARYRAETIYYRRVPRVPMSWLRDSQLTLLRELSIEQGTFDCLHQRTALPVHRIHTDLTCLYYAGAITTTRDRAAVIPAIGHVDTQPHSSATGLESLLSRAALSHFPGDAAALELAVRQRMPARGLFAHAGQRAAASWSPSPHRSATN